METTKKFIEVLKNAKPGFVSMTYTNKQGETAKLKINLGYSYGNAKEKDIDMLENYLRGNDLAYIPSEKYTKADWEQAITELLNSAKSPDLNKSLGQQDAYINITENGTLKWNIETQKLYIHAKVETKEVLVRGEYKEVKSKPLTIAKDAIRKEYLVTGKIRNYILENLEGKMRISGTTLEID